MVTPSERAAQRLKDILIERCVNTGLGFRVFSGSEEPSRESFHIKLDNARPSDNVIKSHGISVFLDPKTARLLSDYELDYLDEPAEGFFLKKEGQREKPAS